MPRGPGWVLDWVHTPLGRAPTLPLGVGTAGPRGRHDRSKIHLKRRFLIKGDYKVIHADSWADLGSSHHFMHNGQEINLVSAKVDEKSMCEVRLDK